MAAMQQQLQHVPQQVPQHQNPVSFSVKLPEFNGTGRVDLWARDMDMLFVAKNCDTVNAHNWACTALKGLALQSLANYRGNKKWNELRDYLLARFKPLAFPVEVRQALYDLKMHKNDLEKYLNEFHELGMQVQDMGDAESIYLFCQGLLPDVRAEILYKGAKTLQQAIEVASA